MLKKGIAEKFLRSVTRTQLKIKKVWITLFLYFYANTASANPFLNAISSMSDFVRNQAGVAIAVLILAVFGIGAMFGKFSWKFAIGFLMGAVILFEAKPLVDWWQGAVRSGA